MNSVILTGRLTRDGEFVETENTINDSNIPRCLCVR